MNKKIYPYHESLKHSLKSTDAVLLGMRLVRELSDMLDIESDDVELLIGLASNKDPLMFNDVCQLVPHLGTTEVNEILAELGKGGMIIKTTIERPRKASYHLFAISDMAKAAIKYVDKNMLHG